MLHCRQMAKTSIFRGLALFFLILGCVSSHAEPLNLADQPLFTGSNVSPNIMVAIDDSGSMDFETVFSAVDGTLHWNSGVASFLNDDGTYRDNSDTYGTYGYLFPREDASPEHPDGRVRTDGDAIPPIPQTAFARSPDYNKAYFNPSTTYTPWKSTPQHEFNPADPTAAQYDPLVGSDTIDLTGQYPKDSPPRPQDRKPFRVSKGMTINGGAEYYDCTSGCDFTTVSVESDDIKVAEDKNYVFKYFPATFYLKSTSELPTEYDSYNKPPLVGYAPGLPGQDNGSTIYGYQIKPSNFDNSEQYQAAIQNFANWFTYYRNRQLAVRGGIVAAFDRISKVRVGTCTINERHDLVMRDLDKSSERDLFYNSIFRFDFSVARGTPNRAALRFLGEQLRTNQSIITEPCQQNFAILFTDGFNNDEVTTPLGGNVDKDSLSAAEYGAPFPDDYENTIADVAMEYYENLGTPASQSLAPNQMQTPVGCNPEPPARPDPSLDCQKNLHMVTFGVTLGQQGTIFNNPDFPEKNNNPYSNPPDWPNPVTGTYSKEQIDDLWHAAINSRGQLLNASTPKAVADAFSATLQKIINSKGSAAAVSANSSSLSSDTIAYQASFLGGLWNGRLGAYRASGYGTGGADKTPLWEAGEILSDPSQTKPSERTILTNLSASGSSPATFTYDALKNISSLTQDEFNYLRGVRSGEKSNGGSYRNRGSDILGDIVHSSPVYVGAPNRFRYPAHWLDKLHPNDSDDPMLESAYSDPTTTTAFAQKNAGRDPTVYVGANDGMLHGFDAKTGQEKLAYVPNAVFSNLASLTDPNYVHRYFVDGTPVSGDVFFGGKWHTVLVGGLGNGGRGIYALDITDPKNFLTSNPGATVLWEYNDSQLGKTFGTPSIVRLHNGQWAAMFGNGYNSDNRCAVLYLVGIENGQLIRKITASNASGNSNHCHGNGNVQDNRSGLSSPFPVDLDGDFITDYAYAGDLQGNLWKFDLTSTNSDSWSDTSLFQAVTKNGDAQPITIQPQVGVHPYGKQYGVMVYFGTGKYLENADASPDTLVQNSVYGIWDLDVFTFNKANGGQPLFSTSLKSNIPRARLTEQSIVDEQTVNGSTYRVLSSNSVDYQHSAADTGGKRGWVLDLPAGVGERVVSNPRIQQRTLSFSTLIPSGQACTPGASGYFTVVDSTTGGRTPFSAFDLNGDRQFNSEDTVEENNEKVGVSSIAFSSDQGAPGAATHVVDRVNQSDTATVSTTSGNLVQFDLNQGRKPDSRRSWREIRR